MYIMKVLMMPNSLLDEHRLNRVNKQDQENLREGLSQFVKRISI